MNSKLYTHAMSQDYVEYLKVTISTLLIFLFSVSLSNRAICQSGSNIRMYSTNEYNYLTLKSDSNYLKQSSSLEKKISRFMKFGDLQSYTLPLVFHILYTEDSTSASQEVLSQIEALNRDFGFLEKNKAGANSAFADYHKLAGDTQIRFCLAKEDPGGKSSSGISAVQDAGTFSGFDDMKYNLSGGMDAWDASEYINVWVVDLDEDLHSYAQWPLGDPETDGIVIDHQYFGQGGSHSYNEGKTLTHLMGSYLGLIELWGEYRCGDDYVEDTPVHNSPNTGSGTMGHVSACFDHPLEMSMNFMDSSVDASLYMFTRGQIKRMQAFLSKEGPRSNLSTQNTKCDEEQ